MAVTREDNSNTKQVLLFPPAKVEATKDNIASADLSGFESALVSVIFGASDVDLGNNNSIQIELQHSDNNADFTACADSDISPSVAGINSGTFAVVNAAIAPEGLAFKAAYKGHKRYVRPVIRCTGQDHGNANHGSLIGINVLLRGSKYRPIA